MRFLSYIISYKGISIEEEWIKGICDWLEPQSVRDIQLVLEFTNFHQQFIQRFSRLAILLTFILKTDLIVDQESENLKQGSKIV